MKKKVYIGTSGYNYEHWKEVFYPKGLPQNKWLGYYAKHFKTVEINATFYGNFKKEVFEKWGNQAPDDFAFCLKGPRFITHVKRLKNVESSVDLFFKNASGLGSKLKIILWQFPKSFMFNEENFGRLKEMLKQVQHDKKRKIRSAFEFRNKSWFNDQVYEIMNKYKCGLVISDSPRQPSPEGEASGGQASFPKVEISTGEFSYIRFHGSSLLYSSEYSEDELKKWVKKIKQLLKLGDVYCYFNNDISGFAVKNARELVQLLR